jgi:hypothetical protein
MVDREYLDQVSVGGTDTTTGGPPDVYASLFTCLFCRLFCPILRDHSTDSSGAEKLRIGHNRGAAAPYPLNVDFCDAETPRGPLTRRAFLRFLTSS